ncbi:MAG TPA: PEP-CTERM sorting domain-containing protein [Gemmatales bacterium]|nr:PEP-CTERM sorting domain-containing protein [Gemmatales bacterium]HMP60100.1 PEP-CTERM sorting domain-containing protein [Gemmatales bacterium]
MIRASPAWKGLWAVVVVLMATTAAQAQWIVRSVAADNPAGIVLTRDLYRTDLGGGTTPGANGLFFDGVNARREINWDGAPATVSAPNFMPANFFNVNSPRGNVYSTPGTGFMLSGAATDGGAGQPAAANFGNIDASYTLTFLQFSPQRLFTPIGSNVMDVHFFVPGTSIPAVTRGFGVVFSDVDQPNLTGFELFDENNNSLGSFFAPEHQQVNGLSFLGVSTIDGSSVIHRARIFLGNTALGPGVLDGVGGNDLVVMDDFIYGEPVAIPEPATLSLLGAAVLAGALGYQRRRQRR